MDLWVVVPAYNEERSIGATLRRLAEQTDTGFSLVVVEAWFAGVPVLVNAGCAATREHCERSGGGLWFGGFAEFEVALERLTADDALRAVLVQRGRRYAEANFRWPRIIDRYQAFLGGVAEHA